MEKRASTPPFPFKACATMPERNNLYFRRLKKASKPIPASGMWLSKIVMAFEEPGKKILPGGKEELGAELSVGVAVADPLEVLAPLEVEGLGGGDGVEVDRVGVRRQRLGIRLGDVEEGSAAQAAD